MTLKSLLMASAMSLTLAATTASAAEKKDAELEETRQKLEQAIKADRPKEHSMRDDNRLPLDTLLFFGFRDDMKVLDLLPGGGYYTRIMGPALQEKGQLYLAIGTDYVENSLLKEEGYKHVKVVSKDTTLERPEGARYYDLNALNLGLSNLDMVTSFRTHHLFDDADRAAVNQAVYDALKPGGIYAMIDHTRRHGEPETEENRRRLDPVKVIKELQDAGFEFVDYTTMHYRPADNLNLEVGHDDVTGRTDRWALKLVKP